MSESELADLENDLEQLRRDYRRQRRLLAFWLVLLTGLTVIGLGGSSTVVMAAKKNNVDKDGVLHVRGPIVDDENGHERVRLGACSATIRFPG
jgi:hypothetical protein